MDLKPVGYILYQELQSSGVSRVPATAVVRIDHHFLSRLTGDACSRSRLDSLLAEPQTVAHHENTAECHGARSKDRI